MALMMGTPGNDMFTGTKAGDEYTGLEGTDKIDGKGGDDLLYGGDDNDTIIGGNGDDMLFGDAGNDSLTAGNGDNTLHGGDDDDFLLGGKGKDKLFGDDGNDSLSGGGNDDTIMGGLGDDTLVGGGGDDLLYGGTGIDKISGGGGGDVIFVGTDMGMMESPGTTFDGGKGLDTLEYTGMAGITQTFTSADLAGLEAQFNSVDALDYFSDGMDLLTFNTAGIAKAIADGNKLYIIGDLNKGDTVLLDSEFYTAKGTVQFHGATLDRFVSTDHETLLISLGVGHVV